MLLLYDEVWLIELEESFWIFLVLNVVVKGLLLLCVFGVFRLFRVFCSVVGLIVF